MTAEKDTDRNPIARAEGIAKLLSSAGEKFIALVKEMVAQEESERRKLIRRGTVEVYDTGERGEFLASFKPEDRPVIINGKECPRRIAKPVYAIGLTPYGAVGELAKALEADKTLGGAE